MVGRRHFILLHAQGYKEGCVMICWAGCVGQLSRCSALGANDVQLSSGRRQTWHTHIVRCLPNLCEKKDLTD